MSQEDMTNVVLLNQSSVTEISQQRVKPRAHSQAESLAPYSLREKPAAPAWAWPPVQLIAKPSVNPLRPEAKASVQIA